MEPPADPAPQQADELGPFQFSLRALLLCVAAVALVLGILRFLLMGYYDAFEVMQRGDCSFYAFQISAAVRKYADDHKGQLPPAYVADENGKPMHSWRVLILPYLARLDCEQLYARYDFSEPWDGPHNCLLAGQMPECYRCPSNPNRQSRSTNYVAVVGPETAWPGEKAVYLKGVTNEPDKTLLLVEVADSDINWMEPRDMSVADALKGVNIDRKHGISSNHRGGANCRSIAGAELFLLDGTCPEVINALLTIAGGEPLEEDENHKLFLRKPPPK